MGVFRDLTIGAIGGAVGYGIGSKQCDKVAKLDQPLSTYIDEYARYHGVYNRDNRFFRELQAISKNYHDPNND